MISNVLSRFASAYSSSVLIGLLHGRYSYLWAEISRSGIPDYSFWHHFTQGIDRLPGYHLANSSATDTITIKPERLAHLCVGQAILYPWMCFTSWFELHRSQDERFSAPSSVSFTLTFLLCQAMDTRKGCVRYDSCCNLNLFIKQTIHYTLY